MQVRQCCGVETTMRDILDNPTIQELGSSIDAKLQAGGKTPESFPPIRRSPRDGKRSLSIQQSAGLRHDLIREETSLRNRQPQVRLGLRIKGDLDARLLETCVNAIIHRHEILRTSYTPVVEAGPLRLEGWAPIRQALMTGRVEPRKISFEQTIHAVSGLKMPVIDLQHLSGVALESEVHAIIRKMVAEPFDYGTQPLLRVRLIRIGPTEHKLLTILPHIVADGWSMNIFRRELFRLYVAARDGSGASLSAPKVQYADFAEYQRLRHEASRHWIARERGREAGGCDSLEATALKFQRRRHQNIIGLSHAQAGYEAAFLDQEYRASLRDAARRVRVTVSMFIFACFGTFLHLSSGASRFGVLITQANRTHPDLEHVFGFIASGQGICMDYTGDPTLASVCQHTRHEFSEAAVRHETDAQRPARHGVGFELNLIEAHDVPGLSIDRFRMLARQRAECGLKLKVNDGGEAGIELGLEFCVDCFSQAAMAAVLQDLKEMTRRAIGNPHVRASEFMDRIRGSIASAS